MALDAFTFAITLPAGDDSRALFHEIVGHVTRYIGLADDVARNAGAVLEKLVEERLAAGGPVDVTFVRTSGSEPVRIEVSGPALAGDEALAARAGAGIVAESDGRRSRLQLAWSVRGDA